MNFDNFTIKSQEAIQTAAQIAARKNQQAIEPAHLLEGVLQVGESMVNYIFQKLGINANMLKMSIENLWFKANNRDGLDPDRMGVGTSGTTYLGDQPTYYTFTLNATF